MSAVKELRERLLLTQTEFAEILKVSRTTIASYEGGHVMPRFKMIKKLIALGSENGMKINANDFFKENLSTNSVDKTGDQ